MPTPDELANDPHTRYEYLLQIIRYWLARKTSFTEIEETLTAAGIAPKHAEQMVELVIQDLQGRIREPGAFPDVDVPLAAIEALGFDTRDPNPAPIDDAVPAMAFADPTRNTRAAVSRAHAASRGLIIQAAVAFLLFLLVVVCVVLRS